MPASIFNAGTVKLLKDTLKFKSGALIISGDSDNPTVVAKDAPASSIYLRAGTNEVYVKQDAGLSTNWTLLSTGGSGEPEVEYRTLTGGEATAKQLTLGATPSTASKVIVDIVSGSAQQFGADYTVSGAVLDWSGLGMDTIGMEAGDVLRIVYWV